MNTTLTGAAATFTAATTSNGTDATCVLSGTMASYTDDNLDIAQPWTITLTATPTAIGTVTAPTALSAASMLYGTDTTTTGITNPPFPFADHSAPVSDPPAVNLALAGLPMPLGFGLGGGKGLTEPGRRSAHTNLRPRLWTWA